MLISSWFKVGSGAGLHVLKTLTSPWVSGVPRVKDLEFPDVKSEDSVERGISALRYESVEVL